MEAGSGRGWGPRIATACLRINALQEYRDLWPTLMNDLLAAVPTGDLNQLKKAERKDRKQIVVDSITLPLRDPILKVH